MSQTFSKIHGLAALRLGWMYGPSRIVDAVNRVRGPFKCRRRRAAGGCGNPGHRPCADARSAHTEKWRKWLTEEVSKLGLEVTPSVANFI